MERADQTGFEAVLVACESAASHEVHLKPGETVSKVLMLRPLDGSGLHVNLLHDEESIIMVIAGSAKLQLLDSSPKYVSQPDMSSVRITSSVDLLLHTNDSICDCAIFTISTSN
jgi:hypothetical protein